MDLELRHLRMICAIAEAGSVSRAASVLGLAQPALTAQLQRIERTLGGPLFERDRRGARPTAMGELVLSRARASTRSPSGVGRVPRESRRNSGPPTARSIRWSWLVSAGCPAPKHRQCAFPEAPPPERTTKTAPPVC